MSRARTLAAVLHASIVVHWYQPAADEDGRITRVVPRYHVTRWK